jgi:hypothetical protein
LRNDIGRGILSPMSCRIVFIVALCALAACQSQGQLDRQPPTWSAAYQVPWETMANCIVARSQRPLVTITPTFHSREGRAKVVESTPTGSVLGTFEIRRLASGATEVSYRSIYGGPGTTAGGDARNTADRCARGG